MKIFYGDRQNVDFAAPVKMTTEQRARLVAWLRERFPCVEDDLVPPSEIRSWRLGERHFSRTWTTCEDDVVVRSIADDPEDIPDVGRLLARSDMSTMMHRVHVIDGYGQVARSVGVDPYARPTSPEERAALEKAIQIYLDRRRDVEKYGEETMKERRDRLYTKINGLQSQLRTHKVLKGRVSTEAFERRLRELEEGIRVTQSEIDALEEAMTDDE